MNPVILRLGRSPTSWVFLALLWALGLLSGCATTEKQVQQTAKDWCMTIRGSQVIPVYPLTEDIQAGDVFLVQVPVDRQQEIYRRRGFLPLDNHIARLDPDGYAAFYDHSFLTSNTTNLLPRDWIRPDGIGRYRGTNGANTASWQAAPRAAFPSYSFSVRNGAGLSLAIPVQGVPVGLSLLNSDAASGTIQIADARTMGVDLYSLYQQLRQWSSTNAEFLRFFGKGYDDARPNYLRVVTRVYAAGRMSVTLKDATSRSGGLDVGAPKPVNLLLPELPSGTNAHPETTLRNYTNAWSVMSEMVRAAGAVGSNANRMLPGGSLKLAAASSRMVGIDETFDPPVIFGYLGFDCAIYRGGVLGPPIPTFAVLDPDYNLGGMLRNNPVYAQTIDKAVYQLLLSDTRNPRAQSAVRQLDSLATYVPNEFTAYSGPGSDGGTPVLSAMALTSAELRPPGFARYLWFHGFRARLDASISALEQSLARSSFQLKTAAGAVEAVTPDNALRRSLEDALAYDRSLRQRMTEDAAVQTAYADAYAYYVEQLIH
ncbi:MAG: hypothetical protein JNL10_14500 [Verrucomicrobiales bacterium]|nr:hypothetical protein [Verrucomicrobiales bacterium]